MSAWEKGVKVEGARLSTAPTLPYTSAPLYRANSLYFRRCTNGARELAANTVTPKSSIFVQFTFAHTTLISSSPGFNEYNGHPIWILLISMIGGSDIKHGT